MAELILSWVVLTVDRKRRQMWCVESVAGKERLYSHFRCILSSVCLSLLTGANVDIFIVNENGLLISGSSTAYASEIQLARARSIEADADASKFLPRIMVDTSCYYLHCICADIISS